MFFSLFSSTAIPLVTEAGIEVASSWMQQHNLSKFVLREQLPTGDNSTSLRFPEPTEPLYVVIKRCYDETAPEPIRKPLYKKLVNICHENRIPVQMIDKLMRQASIAIKIKL